MRRCSRGQGRVRQRYMKWNRTDLVNQLLSVEQQYAEMQERYLATCDQLLEWQLRAQTAEALVHQEREHRQGKAGHICLSKPCHPGRASAKV